jgi:hypothetical protein
MGDPVDKLLEQNCRHLAMLGFILARSAHRERFPQVKTTPVELRLTFDAF